MLQVVVKKIEGGAFIKFPKDEFLNESLKEVFPWARWNKCNSSWYIPGGSADQRASEWAASVEEVAIARQQERRQALVAAFEAIPQSKFISLRETDVAVKTPYNIDINIICRKELRGKFEGNQTWAIPASSVAKLGQFVAEIDEIVTKTAEAEAAEAARKESERAARNAEYEANKAKWIEKAAERRENRFISPFKDAPREGRLHRLEDGKIVMVEHLGMRFRSHYNREWLRYVYYRPATEEEIASVTNSKETADA